METRFMRAAKEAVDDFKSHHSGMETVEVYQIRFRSENFKSHHSGMETGSLLRVFADFTVLEIPL